MAEINANFVVQPFGITVTPDAPGISVTATPTNLNVYSLGYAQPSGNVGELQFNLNGQVLGGAANTLASNGNVRFTNISNLKINGGANAYFLQTDGTGNLTWAQGTANVSGNGTAAGANTQIQISDGTGNFTSGAGFTFDNATNVFSTPGNVFIAGNANIVGNIANANITNALVGNTANFSGNVSANYFIGNGSQLTGIDPTQIQNGTANVRTFLNSNVTISAAGNANVVVVQGNAVTINGDQFFNGNGAWGAQNMQANYINANYVVGTLVTSAQPNITSVGTLGNLSVTGNIVSGNVYANTGTIGANLLTGTLTTNAQPNITSLGTLVNLSVSGNINANIITANIINGNVIGSLANGTSNVAIPIANGNVNISANGNPNVLIVQGSLLGTTVTVNGNANIVGNTFTNNLFANTGEVRANLLYGNIMTSSQGNINQIGNLLGLNIAANFDITMNGPDSNISGANLISANFFTGTLTTNAQPNITSVGTLGNLSVTGNTVSGNVYANSGTIGANLLIGNGVNSSSFFYFSEQIELLASNVKLKTSLVDRLILNSTAANFTVPVITSGNITANNASFTEWANANNITVTANINAGNVKTDNLLYANGAPYDFEQPGGTNTNIQFNDANDLGGSNAFTFDKSTNAVSLTGNLTTGNANLGNLVIANFFSGAGNNLSNIQGANITGAVSIANTANTANLANIANLVTTSNVDGNSGGQFFIVFTSNVGNNQLQIDNVGNALVYTPSTAKLTFDIAELDKINAQGDSDLAIRIDNTNKKIRFDAGTTFSNIMVIGNTTIDVTKPIKMGPTTVSSLGNAANIGAGARFFVSDSNVVAAGNFGEIVYTGGSNNVPVYSDGTNWRIG